MKCQCSVCRWTRRTDVANNIADFFYAISFMGHAVYNDIDMFNRVGDYIYWSSKGDKFSIFGIVYRLGRAIR